MAETAQPQQSQNAVRLRNLTSQKWSGQLCLFVFIKCSHHIRFGRPCLNEYENTNLQDRPQQSVNLFVFGHVCLQQPLSLADNGSRHWVLWGLVFLWLDAKRNLNVIRHKRKHPDEEGTYTQSCLNPLYHTNLSACVRTDTSPCFGRMAQISALCR